MAKTIFKDMDEKVAVVQEKRKELEQLDAELKAKLTGDTDLQELKNELDQVNAEIAEASDLDQARKLKQKATDIQADMQLIKTVNANKKAEIAQELLQELDPYAEAWQKAYRLTTAYKKEMELNASVITHKADAKKVNEVIDSIDGMAKKMLQMAKYWGVIDSKGTYFTTAGGFAVSYNRSYYVDFTDLFNHQRVRDLNYRG